MILGIQEILLIGVIGLVLGAPTLRRLLSSDSAPAPNAQGEQPLLVFVSSQIAGFRSHREKLQVAISDTLGGIAKPWVFECTSASSEQLDDSYLAKVRECDIFVLILGRGYSRAVEAEFDEALALNKPVLAFVEEIKGQSEEENAHGTPEEGPVIGRIRTKYATFSDEAELTNKVLNALRDELVRAYRQYGLSMRDKALLSAITIGTLDSKHILASAHQAVVENQAGKAGKSGKAHSMSTKLSRNVAERTEGSSVQETDISWEYRSKGKKNSKDYSERRAWEIQKERDVLSSRD